MTSENKKILKIVEELEKAGIEVTSRYGNVEQTKKVLRGEKHE